MTLFGGGSKITADGDCSHEIKRRLLLGRKAMINLDSILKSRDVTLPTKVRPVKAMVFPVVMYGCESWTVKNAERRSADDITLMAESKEELKSLLMKVKKESEKAGLKLNIHKTKIMASSPITSWQIDRETVEMVRDFIFGGLPNHCRW